MLRCKMIKLTRYERETIINFNEEEPDAEIFTYNKRWQRHLETKFGIVPTETNSSGGKTYTLPKDCIRLPQPKRKLSEEQKNGLTNRLRTLRKVHKDKNTPSDRQ